MISYRIIFIPRYSILRIIENAWRIVTSIATNILHTLHVICCFRELRILFYLYSTIGKPNIYVRVSEATLIEQGLTNCSINAEVIRGIGMIKYSSEVSFDENQYWQKASRAIVKPVILREFPAVWHSRYKQQYSRSRDCCGRYTETIVNLVNRIHSSTVYYGN